MDNAATVNDQITDSVTQASTLILGSSVPIGNGMLDVVSAETFGIGMHNAVTTQQNAQLTSNASVTAACARMLAIQRVTPPAPDKAPVTTPPPFMPLATNGNDKPTETPSALFAKAQTLIENAKTLMSGQKAVDDKTKQAEQALNTVMKGLDDDAKNT